MTNLKFLVSLMESRGCRGQNGEEGSIKTHLDEGTDRRETPRPAVIKHLAQTTSE